MTMRTKVSYKTITGLINARRKSCEIAAAVIMTKYMDDFGDGG
jgi:hypothetical protein